MQAREARYIYIFDDIGSEPGNVRIVSPYHAEMNQIQIAVNDNQFLYRRHTRMDPHLADLVDIAVAVYVADRLSIRRHEHKQRSLYLHLPLRHPEIFERDEVYTLLQDTLHHYSHDEWEFEFVQRVDRGRMSELQTSIEEADQHVEVALWSGGLDSLTGLYNRIDMRSAPAYTLFGTGSNLLIQGVQKRTALQMQIAFPKKNIKLEQVPFRFVKIDKVRENNVPRLRGFLFLLLGAVCACLEGQQTLHVYENGVGAINLPYLRSSTGLDHSRAVHPISLCYMSELLSAILQVPFTFRNPFLFWTKAQMCALPVKRQESWLISSTITCDRRRRAQHIQCGRCSSCLLRQQALLANGMEEQFYVVPAARRAGGPADSKDGEFLRAMLWQVDALQKCLNTPDPWAMLAREYADLPSVVWWLASANQGEQQDIEQLIVQLYQCYVAEWSMLNVRRALSYGLLLDDEMAAVA
jgi:Queuosine biosynthesis protein QueC